MVARVPDRAVSVPTLVDDVAQGQPEMSETSELWRAVKDASRKHKDDNEPYRIFRLHRARERDLLCFEKLSEHHYRVWHPDRHEDLVDFWPRTSAIRYRGETFKGWVKLMKILGIPRKSWQLPK